MKRKRSVSPSDRLLVDDHVDDLREMQRKESISSEESDTWQDDEEFESDEWDEEYFSEHRKAAPTLNLNVCYVWALLEHPRDIRLAVLSPDPKSGNEVTIELQKMSLDRPVPYYTLSYTWGKQYEDKSHLTHSIKCGVHRFPVTAHLYAALRRIRDTEPWHDGHHRSPKIPLWIDALCINQLDNKERSHQVRIMDDIYRTAVSTIVWLGEEDDEGGFSIIKDLQKLQGLSNQPSSGLGFLSLKATVSALIDCSSDTLEQCNRLLEREWFTRRWILQEYVLSRDVDFLIGRTWLPSSFVRLIAHMSGVQLLPAILTQEGISRRSLFDNLVAFRHSKCTDLHDYIYALLGISVGGREIHVDYSSPAGDLLVNFASQHMMPEHPDIHEGDVDSKRLAKLLGWAILSKESYTPATGPQSLDAFASNNPSWVPNWCRTGAWPEVPDSASWSTEPGATDNPDARRSQRIVSLTDIERMIHVCIEDKTLLLDVFLLDVTTFQSRHEALVQKVDALRDSHGIMLGAGLESHLQLIRLASMKVVKDVDRLVNNLTASGELTREETAFVLPDSDCFWKMSRAETDRSDSATSATSRFKLEAFSNVGTGTFDLGVRMSSDHLTSLCRNYLTWLNKVSMDFPELQRGDGGVMDHLGDIISEDRPLWSPLTKIALI